MRLSVNRNLPLAALVFLLAACGGGGERIDSTPPSPTGPAGDYPMVLGPAYSIGGISYTPADVMNYDAVGLAEVSGEGGTAITVAHHTLPLPSYVEVTALDTGRTILARVERRGPMTGTQLVQLSPGAAAQLGLTSQASADVRVRRVNPTEPERALLRSGQQAPARMDTPKSLLEVLRRKLGAQGTELTRAPAPPPPSGAVLPPRVQPVKPEPQGVTPPPRVAAPKPPKPAPVVTSAPAALPRGSLVVQIGAFSDPARANAVASKSGAQVVPGGGIHRVRMGPFRTQAEADAALAKARAAGYSEARIQRVN